MNLSFVENRSKVRGPQCTLRKGTRSRGLKSITYTARLRELNFTTAWLKTTTRSGRPRVWYSSRAFKDRVLRSSGSKEADQQQIGPTVITPAGVVVMFRNAMWPATLPCK